MTSASAGSVTAYRETATTYEGACLVNRNGYQHRFLVAPNSLQQTSLGIRGKEEFLPGWSVVFNASTGINPRSGCSPMHPRLTPSTTAFRGSYAFSYIGYNGTMAGGGDTENSRWDNAVKYRLAVGPVHFGAMYKFADGSGGC